MADFGRAPMRWHCLQHVPFEQPGLLAEWVADRGHSLSVTRLWANEPFPTVERYDGLFILGGPMNVYEESEYRWLADEKSFLARAVADHKPILGVCLGAQLLSVVLGGRVTRARHSEIGWFPVRLTPAGRNIDLFHGFVDPLMSFHWHGDRFSIPPRAVHVAYSDACDEQAFVYDGHVVGLQFHLECDVDNIASLVEHCGNATGDGPYIQSARAIESFADCIPAARDHLFVLLDRLAQVDS